MTVGHCIPVIKESWTLKRAEFRQFTSKALYLILENDDRKAEAYKYNHAVNLSGKSRFIKAKKGPGELDSV